MAAFLESINTLLPFWFRISVGKGQLFAPENLHAVFGEGRKMTGLKLCSGISFDTNDKYVVYAPKMPLEYTILSSVKRTVHNSERTCIAVNLCKGSLEVSLPENHELDFTDDFSAFGINNVKLLSKYIQIHSNPSCFTFKKLQIPDKDCIRPDMSMDISGDIWFPSSSSVLSVDGALHLQFSNTSKVSIAINMNING